MTILFGSGQTSGLPLLITADTLGARQLLHTAPLGVSTPNRIRIMACNLDTDKGHTLYIEVEDALATVRRTITETIPAQSGLFPALEELSELDLNGACTIKVWADEASKVMVTAMVENQASVANLPNQILYSGLIAAAQNANRFGVGIQGGAGTATEANHQILIPRAGIIRNMSAVPDGAVGAGAIVTVVARVNGVGTSLTLQFENADGTTLKTDTDSVAVAAGDLFTFLVTCDDGGAPAANFQVALEYSAN